MRIVTRKQNRSPNLNRWQKLTLAVLGNWLKRQGRTGRKQLKPPEDWRKGVTRAMGELLGEQSIEERLAEIRETIRRMDFRWDHGSVTDEGDFMEKRLQLQQELEQFTPIPEDDLERAADILEHFADHWAACEGDPEAQYKLIKLIVKRVYVLDDEIVAMTLRSDYHVVLGHKLNGPTEVPVDPHLYTIGSDGRWVQNLGTKRRYLSCRYTAVSASAWLRLARSLQKLISGKKTTSKLVTGRWTDPASTVSLRGFGMGAETEDESADGLSGSAVHVGIHDGFVCTPWDEQ